MQPIGFDTETLLIGPNNVIPPLVCLSVGWGEGESFVSAIADGKADFFAEGEEPPHQVFRELLESDSPLVGHNVSYDLSVLGRHHSPLVPLIFQALEDKRIHCTLIREKLLNLALSGNPQMTETPQGNRKKVGLHLADLETKYLGIDRTPEKEEEDAWRMHYGELAELPSKQWPESALKYARVDAETPARIWAEQEKVAKDIEQKLGAHPFSVEAYKVSSAFCLYQWTANGLSIDPDRYKKIKAELLEELSHDKCQDLILAGILQPGLPSRPMAGGRKDHISGCDRKCKCPPIEGMKRKRDHVEGCGGKCDCPPKFKDATKDVTKRKRLQQYVQEKNKLLGDKVCPIKYTDKGNISVDSDWVSQHWHLSKILEQYRHRQKWAKIVNTELPRLEWPKGSGRVSDQVHACYDVLKETGRTSSYSTDNYPSWNGQNVDPRARVMIVPRPGYKLFSLDYGQMEFVSLAQQLLSLFGNSVMAEKIRAGYDLHSYLGCQISLSLEAGFREYCKKVSAIDPDSQYRAFMSFKHHPRFHSFHAKYRTLAKPTGLGYPGGLGARTMVNFARGYGVTLTVEEAEHLKEIWFQTFPEMRTYFKYISSRLVDKNHYGDRGDRYSYISPLGMIRTNASFCAAANGLGLQTPSTEGAQLAVIQITREIMTPESPLAADDQGDRVRPSLFIHDEMLGEVRSDVATVCVNRISQIMIDSFSVVCPDVPIKVSSLLMDRWSKEAKRIEDPITKELVAWSEKEQA